MTNTSQRLECIFLVATNSRVTIESRLTEITKKIERFVTFSLVAAPFYAQLQKPLAVTHIFFLTVSETVRLDYHQINPCMSRSLVLQFAV
jgi:hypothetical protein